MFDTSDIKRSKLRLVWDLPLRDAFIESFDSIIDYAVSKTGTATQDPEKSVHEYRKSIRRARSAIRLLHDSHQEFDRTEINDRLRSAFAPTSLLRDADVLLPVIEMWSHLAPDETAVEQITASLTDHRSDVKSHDAATILAAEVEGLHYCKWLLRKHVPDLDWGHVQEGFRKSYRRCKKRRHLAATYASELAVHDWRKRTKEIRYQTEMFAAGTSIEPVATINKDLADLAQGLGEATDLQIFSDYLSERFHINGVSDWQANVYEEYLRSLGASVLKSNTTFRSEPDEFSAQIVNGILEALRKFESDESE